MTATPMHETPHLQTAVTGPLQLLEKQLLCQQNEIEDWFHTQWQYSPAPVYGSVDLRNAGFKLAPVDMNLFPAGFNNLILNSAFLPLAVEAAKIALQKIVPDVKRILLIPENHTRNIFYWENIQALLDILQGAGFTVRIGSLLPDLTEPRDLQTSTKIITLEPLKREGNKLQVNGFVPDLILLNNDLTESIPDILQNITQPMVPPAELGWNQRLKSEHFQYYAGICDEFAKIIQIDPWFIAPLFRHCGDIDFMRREGEDCLAENAEILLEAIQKKYTEYDIPHQPYIVIKAEAGTYGMAVMMIKSVAEIHSLNRKQRTSMSKSKGGQPVHSVIIQEGVYTFETWGVDNAVAEPVVYLWGERVVGGFYRVHKDRGVDENLNSPGMHFEPIAFAKTCRQPSSTQKPEELENRFYAYGVIARLSMLAAAREMLEHHNGR